MLYQFRTFQNQIGVWGQTWVFLVLLGIRSDPPPPPPPSVTSQDIRQKCDQLVTWKVVLLRLHESQWWMKRLSIHLLLTVLPPPAQTLYMHNIHTYLAARSPRWLMSWLTGVSNMEEIVNQPGRRGAAVLWRCHCRTCWKGQAEDKHQEASLCGGGAHRGHVWAA